MDTYTSIRKQYLMIKTMLDFGHMEAEALKTGATAAQVAAFPVKSKISKMKWTPEEQVEAFIAEIQNDMNTEFGSLVQEVRAQ